MILWSSKKKQIDEIICESNLFKSFDKIKTRVMSLLVGVDGGFIGIAIHGSRSMAVFTTMTVILIAF